MLLWGPFLPYDSMFYLRIVWCCPLQGWVCQCSFIYPWITFLLKNKEFYFSWSGFILELRSLTVPTSKGSLGELKDLASGKEIFKPRCSEPVLTMKGSKNLQTFLFCKDAEKYCPKLYYTTGNSWRGRKPWNREGRKTINTCLINICYIKISGKIFIYKNFWENLVKKNCLNRYTRKRQRVEAQ